MNQFPSNTFQKLAKEVITLQKNPIVKEPLIKGD